MSKNDRSTLLCTFNDTLEEYLHKPILEPRVRHSDEVGVTTEGAELDKNASKFQTTSTKNPRSVAERAPTPLISRNNANMDNLQLSAGKEHVEGIIDDVIGVISNVFRFPDITLLERAITAHGPDILNYIFYAIICRPDPLTGGPLLVYIRRIYWVKDVDATFVQWLLSTFG